MYIQTVKCQELRSILLLKCSFQIRVFDSVSSKAFVDYFLPSWWIYPQLLPVSNIYMEYSDVFDDILKTFLRFMIWNSSKLQLTIK